MSGVRQFQIRLLIIQLNILHDIILNLSAYDRTTIADIEAEKSVFVLKNCNYSWTTQLCVDIAI